MNPVLGRWTHVLLNDGTRVYGTLLGLNDKWLRLHTEDQKTTAYVKLKRVVYFEQTIEGEDHDL
jgi:hypothetical protein